MRLSNLFVFASAATSAIAQYYGDQYDIDSAQYNIDDTEYDGTEFISRPAAVVYSGKNNQAIRPTGMCVRLDNLVKGKVSSIKVNAHSCTLYKDSVCHHPYPRTYLHNTSPVTVSGPPIESYSIKCY